MDARPLRIVTAAALFDGHDAAINLVRRLLVAQGAQVIHLGHNRSVGDIVKAAVEEDADAVCVSSYQGGHMDFFRYLAERLREEGASGIQVFGGGGGVILPEEGRALEAAGVRKIFTPGDGMRLGMEGMIADLLGQVRAGLRERDASTGAGERLGLSRSLTAALAGPGVEGAIPPRIPVVGLTGTGGAGKSSLADELVRRFLQDFPALRVAVLAIDPARKASGGALLGDRLRMNACGDERVFFRSLAGAGGPAMSAAIRRGAARLKESGAGLVLLETSGIGQGDTELMDMSDTPEGMIPLYVMTSEFGAGTQLEKINMLDFAEMVVINKFEDKRAEDALQAVRRQWRHARASGESRPGTLAPVYGTVASRFNDPGVDRLYLDLLARIEQRFGGCWRSRIPDPGPAAYSCDRNAPIVPPARSRYLQEITRAVRAYRTRSGELARRADRLQALEWACGEVGGAEAAILLRKAGEARESLGPEGLDLLRHWEALRKAYGGDAAQFQVREHARSLPLIRTTLSGLPIRRVQLPDTDRWGEILRFLRQENLPGHFPYTAGAFPFRRQDEDPKRQFAGEGGPERTNRRFHFLCRDTPSKRLSTAFDSVTLYGEDPDERPDIYGKVGESGVSIATLDDMKELFQGFDLCDPDTSVSMTINGPAPVILAMFFNAAMDQQLERHRPARGALSPAEESRIRQEALVRLRGTVQADILKEDQAQNTCIFSIEFALRMMGDVQQFIIDHGMRNYYPVSISGYHIAEAGAGPVSQLAFTLANGFTLVEYYLGRGMSIDEIAPRLSFFFSSGLDPEYAVLGRVARRIWAIALRDVYGAGEAGRRLKYHIQTSGRSLHLQEMKFNDIRTTLQALTALLDNCNSLHTNAYDEALTTPTEASVRLAMAIQLIITREFGLYWNENALQGSHFLARLTDDLEEAVLEAFLDLDARGGVLRAMETQYQRFAIQEQSLRYETLKHSGELPIVGVNTFLQESAETPMESPVSRAAPGEKEERLQRLRAFQDRHRDAAGPALERLKDRVRSGGNIFEILMETVRVASLGQVTSVLYEMGGRYRRAM